MKPNSEFESHNTRWDAVTSRLLNSRNRLEREHICLGFHAEYGYPILYHKALLPEHFHVLGGSGSGKTTKVLTPLEAALIRGGDGAVIVMDLKGELGHSESVRKEATKARRRFKHFTNQLGLSSYLFNSFQQMNSRTTSVSQQVETIMESLRLNHGDGYGARYFSIQGRQWLSNTVRRWPNIASFEELREKAKPEFFKNESEMDRCRELISVVEQVAEVTAMNWKPKPGESNQPLKDAIFMPDVVRNKEVVYFMLPALGETSTVKEIANLALYSIVTAVKQYHEEGGRGRTYLIIDEFQQMASEGFKLILRQARKFGLCLILANQSEADLMTRQANRLLDVVRTNTQTKIYMSVDEQNTVKMLEKASGMYSYIDHSPRLDSNAIRSYSSHPDYAICWITRDSGFTTYGGDWFGMRTEFHITNEEYQARDEAPWPEKTESTIVAQPTHLDGTRAISERGGDMLLVLAEQAEASLNVPTDSKWATRLMDIYKRRNAGKVND